VHNRELKMKRLVFAVGILALGVAAATPARADYAVVRWDSGYCQLWWDSASTPWGAGWTKIAIAPTRQQAWAARDAAIMKGACR
jgi:hypothetical protein